MPDRNNTPIDFINRNGQRVIAAIQLPGNTPPHRLYVLRCGHCANEYGASGPDVWERRCPSCQGGEPGTPTTYSP